MTHTDNKLTYAQLKYFVDQPAEQAKVITAFHFACASLDLMKSDPSLKDQYIADYMKAADILSLQLQAARSAGDKKAVDHLKACKFMLDSSFTTSGAADYQTVQKIYAARIDENKTNIAYLKDTIALFRQLNCEQIDAYSAALGYAYELKPSADIAADLGRLAMKNNDLDTAFRFFEEATHMETDNNVNADYYYIIASLLFTQHKYLQARDYCRKATELNPAHGSAYVLIGNIYAANAQAVYPGESVLARAVYYAAIDQFEKGKQVDPAVTDKANSLINIYRAHLPSVEDIFFHPDLEKGKSFMIGGWINERTTIR